MTEKPSVALIGAGAMGGALLKGWLAAGSINGAASAIFDPAADDEITSLCKQHKIVANSDAVAEYDAVVIAVKPQIAADVLPAYAGLARNAIVISIMAGKSTVSISKALKGAGRIARAMPNLPAAIGKGVTGVYATPAVDECGRKLVESLMRAAGEVVWVKRETDIDIITAVSGSGPAYYFLLTEALAEAGEAVGLDKSTAAALARATLAGAGALIETETRAPADMRKAVTSPGGTRG
mgnify:FL=1